MLRLQKCFRNVSLPRKQKPEDLGKEPSSLLINKMLQDGQEKKRPPFRRD